MILHIPNVIDTAQVEEFRRHLATADWSDGAATAGDQARTVKANRQLPENSAIARRLSETVLGALAQSPRFISAALPLKIYPPMFNLYGTGETYGLHADNALRIVPGTPVRVRTDLSATLFLSAPDTYDGGDLVIEDNYGAHSVKLPAGDMILYPSTSLHKVSPVTKGERLASFFWVQSMIRSHDQREILFDLDQSIQSLTIAQGHDHPDVMRLTAVYQKLIRELADT